MCLLSETIHPTTIKLLNNRRRHKNEFWEYYAGRDASGKIVIGRLNKDKDNVLGEEKTLAQLCAEVGWSQPPYRHMPGCIKLKNQKLPDVCSRRVSTSS